MTRHTRCLIVRPILRYVLTLLTLATGVTVAHAERYSKDIRFSGSVATSEHISGFPGTSFVVGVPDASGNDDYALFGLASEEQRDHPCYVKLYSENINDWSGQQELSKELCDGSPSSKEIVAAYGNPHYEKRSFISGVRVCMNKQNDRVKGIQIRGQTISDFGTIHEVFPGDPGKDGQAHPKEPKDIRPNCDDNWKRWATCPKDNQIATAVVLHFEAGKQPRSLIGIGLHCRSLEVINPVTGTPF